MVAKITHSLFSDVTETGKPEVAVVYVATLKRNPEYKIEFVDALDPRYSRDEKWCINVSTQIGCPVGCVFCDATGFFYGNLTKDEIFAEIDSILSTHKDDGSFNTKKLKLHFARMGEPALNPAVLEVLMELPEKYNIPELIPAVATIAPDSGDWLKQLLEIKRTLFNDGHFQLQLSINSTEPEARDKLMPVKKWDMERLGKYTSEWWQEGDRKVSLNFALAKEIPVDPKVIAKYFDPKSALIKVTPINPTLRSVEQGVETVIAPEDQDAAFNLINEFERLGFEVIVSIGDSRENEIGSNCGQAARKAFEACRLVAQVDAQVPIAAVPNLNGLKL